MLSVPDFLRNAGHAALAGVDRYGVASSLMVVLDALDADDICHFEATPALLRRAVGEMRDEPWSLLSAFSCEQRSEVTLIDAPGSGQDGRAGVLIVRVEGGLRAYVLSESGASVILHPVLLSVSDVDVLVATEAMAMARDPAEATRIVLDAMAFERIDGVAVPVTTDHLIFQVIGTALIALRFLFAEEPIGPLARLIRESSVTPWALMH